MLTEITKVDASGAIYLSAAMREAWGITANTELVLLLTPDGLIIRPKAASLDALAALANLAQPLGPADLATQFDGYTQRVLNHDSL